MSFELPHCFDGFPPDVIAYEAGSWKERSGPRPYRLPASFWPTIGSKVHAELPQHYGKCDDARRGRALYEWVPTHCSMLPFVRERACEFLAGKQIVVVGDSTVLQFFISLVHLLGGMFGRDVKHGYVTADLTASACADTTRLVFIRSDLLLWTHSVPDYHAVQRCDGFTILHPFVMRASRDADIVLLGVGHHVPRALMLAEKWSHWAGKEVAKRARVGFFARNLNHTLTSLLARRAAWGRRDPASVVILGASTPVRGCARYSTPLRDPLEAAIIASGGDGDRDRENVSTNELRWMQYPRYNQLARALASALGTSFIDVAAPSALRPDGAMGGYWPAGDARQRDCVHYCLPGAVDTWATFLYNLISSKRLRAAMTTATHDGRRGGGQRTSNRFLAANVSEWLRVKGYAERLEACTNFGATAGSTVRKGACESRMQQLPWWAFRCIENRDRRAIRGEAWATTWTPWMPPESFD